jgi:succinate-semialdehyde dehydrogenase/glutarate-semialdehyde dehydrogenase
MDEKTTHGPLSTEGALVQLLKQVDAAVKDGAKLLMGGKRIDRLGLFMGIQEFVNKKLVRTAHFPAPT